MSRDTVKRCPQCGASDARFERVELELERGEVHITVRGIPGYACHSCGESVFDPPIADAVSEGAHRITSAIEEYLEAPTAALR